MTLRWDPGAPGRKGPFPWEVSALGWVGTDLPRATDKEGFPRRIHHGGRWTRFVTRTNKRAPNAWPTDLGDSKAGWSFLWKESGMRHPRLTHTPSPVGKVRLVVIFATGYILITNYRDSQAVCLSWPLNLSGRLSLVIPTSIPLYFG